MSQSATLPDGWAKILDDIRRHVDDAVATTDARIAKTPVAGVASSSIHQQSFAEIGQRLQGVSDRLRSAEQVIEATDQVLQAEETRLQQHLAGVQKSAAKAR